MKKRKPFRNPATAGQIKELGDLIGVTFTKPMRKGTYMKLKRMANLTGESAEEEKFDRQVFWEHVAVYTDSNAAELASGRGESVEADWDAFISYLRWREKEGAQ